MSDIYPNGTMHAEGSLTGSMEQVGNLEGSLRSDGNLIGSIDKIMKVPTKTSDLINDSGFITEDDIPPIPEKTSDLTNDSGFITEDDIPPIPEKTSDLTNDSGFITEDDIPPLVTDLGTIDPEPYDDDISLYLNTLTESGWYKFFWDSGDDYSYFAQVQSIEYGDAIFVNQHCWGLEETPITEWVRGVIIEDGEVVYEESSSYMTFDAASSTFAMKTHQHYRTDSKALSVFDYCDGSQIKMQNGSPILYTDTLNSKQYVIETWQAIRQPTYDYQKITELTDSSVIYQRSGLYQSGVIHWRDWYKFSGTIFDPGGR